MVYIQKLRIPLDEIEKYHFDIYIKNVDNPSVFFKIILLILNFIFFYNKLITFNFCNDILFYEVFTS